MTSNIEIDLLNLKYNLYEILNVQENTDDNIIKKNYIKLIKNYHPDRNSELEEDIYQHIILANKILLDKNLRKKYDEFIFNKNKDYNELKKIFNNNLEKIQDDKLFNKKSEELNIKHGYNENINNNSLIDKLNIFKSSRNNKDIIITKNIDLKKNNFNNEFIINKNNIKNSDQIIEYNECPAELSAIIGETYINLYDIEKLYIEDSILSSNFTSLDKAFILLPENNINNNNILSMDDRLKQYNK